MRRPRLLLLDEPLDSLDLPNQAAVAALVQEICRSENVAVLIVAHDVNPILGYLDRVVYLAGGARRRGRARRGDHQRDAERACTATPIEVLQHLRRPARRGRPAGGAVRALHPAMSTELAALSADPISDLHELFTYHFMVNALGAGTIVAVTAAAIGWFMVLRRQTFAGHTLSLVAFPGAAAAALAGAPAFVRLLRVCTLGALALSPASAGATRSLSEESAAIGTVQAFALALRLPVRQPLPRRPEQPRTRCCSAPSSASPTARCCVLGAATLAVLVALMAIGTAALLRLGRPGAARGQRRARGRARHRLPGAARPRGGRDQPDHRRAARVRAAGRPAGHRAAR